MKQLFFTVIIASALAACGTVDKKVPGEGLSAEQRETATKDSANFTTIAWPDSTFKNIGDVAADESKDVVFRFRNTGNKPLIISSVTASCGCTIPEAPGKPYAPGEEGEIRASFHTAVTGTAHKTITVNANTKPNTRIDLYFTAEVK